MGKNRSELLANETPCLLSYDPNQLFSNDLTAVPEAVETARAPDRPDTKSDRLSARQLLDKIPNDPCLDRHRNSGGQYRITMSTGKSKEQSLRTRSGRRGLPSTRRCCPAQTEVRAARVLSMRTGKALFRDAVCSDAAFACSPVPTQALSPQGT